VTNEDQVVALFAKANPVPSLDLLDPVEPLDMERLEHLSERNSIMTEVETIQPNREEPQRWPRVALGLAMGVIAVVALGILVNRESVVASPVSVATAYMDANSEYDVNGMWELLAPDSEAKLAGLAALTLANDWARAVGWAEINQGCEEISTDSTGTLVACPFIRQTDWILALGLKPVTNNIYEILVAEGQIQSVVETDNGDISGAGEIKEASAMFELWVTRNHPDDIATMYGSGGEWLNDPAAIALYEKYTDEFVASQGG
jgi:hypothetical protein